MVPALISLTSKQSRKKNSLNSVHDTSTRPSREEFLKFINNKFQGWKPGPSSFFQGSVASYGFEWNRKNLVAIEEFVLNFEGRTETWRTSCKHKSTRTADFIAVVFWRSWPALVKEAHHLQGKRTLKNSAIYKWEACQLLESRFNSFRVQRGKKLLYVIMLDFLRRLVSRNRREHQHTWSRTVEEWSGQKTFFWRAPKSLVQVLWSCKGCWWCSQKPCVFLHMYQNVRLM